MGAAHLFQIVVFKTSFLKDANEMALDAIDEEAHLFRECNPSKNDISGDEIIFERLAHCNTELSKRVW